MLGSGMPILNAVGSSLFSVGAFGLTTAINYAVSGLVDWAIALEFIVGGALGGLLGTRTAVKLSAHKRALTYCLHRNPVHRRGVHAGANSDGAPRRELVTAKLSRAKIPLQDVDCLEFPYAIIVRCWPR